jgi:hypothetical protein
LPAQGRRFEPRGVRSGAGCRAVAFAIVFASDAIVEFVPLLGQAAPDDLERQKVFPLLSQNPAQPLHIMVVELAVAGRRPLRIDQALALQEADFGNGDVRKLLAKQGQHLAD